MSLKLSDHVERARLLFVSHSYSNYPLGSLANSMDNRTVGRRRNTSQIVSPLNFLDRRIHRRMRLGRIQDMLKLQSHMLWLSRESLDFIQGSSKMSSSQKSPPIRISDPCGSGRDGRGLQSGSQLSQRQVTGTSERSPNPRSKDIQRNVTGNKERLH